jgi:hypothetical protein
MEHTNTHLWAENSVRTSQETHYVFSTKPNLLMLLREQSLFIVRTIRNTQIRSVGRKLSPCLTGDTLHLRYKAQPVNAV